MFDINRIDRITLDDIEWKPAPSSYDHSGRLFHILLAQIDEETDEPQLILAHDIDSGKSSLAATPNGRDWFDSAHSQDWGALDRMFGREEWQALVAEHQEEAIAELDSL